MARPKSNTTNVTGPIPDALYAAIDDARWGLKLEMKSVVTQAVTQWAERHGVTVPTEPATESATQAPAAPGEAPAAPDAAPASAHPSRKR